MNQGLAEQVNASRRDSPEGIAFIEARGSDAALRQLVLGDAPSGVPGLRAFLECLKHPPGPGEPREAWGAWARELLLAHGDFQLLAAVRRGPFGVEALNREVATLLQGAGLTAASAGWYAGRPVIVTRNDYTLDLMNGDVGVTVPFAPQGTEPGRTGLRVVFPGESGTVRWVLPSRLPEVETAYALTVHKSQGSEFRHAALVLPERDSPVLTRELIYTAITRASQRFTLLQPAGSPALECAIGRPTQRASGLMAD